MLSSKVQGDNMKAKDFNHCLNLLRNGDNQGLRKLYNTYYYATKQVLLLRGKDEAAAEIILDAFFQNLEFVAQKVKKIKKPDLWVFYMINQMCDEPLFDTIRQDLANEDEQEA